MALFDDMDDLTGLSSVLTKERGTMKALRRPNCWTFDLCLVTSDSGYCSTENSTEYEEAPFDFKSVVHELEKLQPINAQLDVPQPVQYVLSDCTFRLKIDTTFGTTNKLFDSLSLNDVVVMGPSGRPYNVTQSPGKDRSEMIYSFRPLETGAFTCRVELGCSHCPDPSPLIIIISRRYEDKICRSICTMDIELPPTLNDENKMEKRKPWGLCSNTRTEQIFVADREKHEILVFRPDGEPDFKFGGHGALRGQFFRPTAVAYDAVRDRILVSDKDNHRIQVFTAQGQFIKSFGRRGSYNSQFFFPWGVAVSNNGELIAVVDSRNHRIQLFDGEFRFIRMYTAKTQGQPKTYKQEFDYPRGICFDDKGENVFVTDFNLHCLFKLDIHFSRCERIMTRDQLKRPQGICLDRSGNIILCDSRNNSIKVISTDGTLISEIQKLGNSTMDLPLDIACMKGGYLAILDMNGRIRIF